MKLKPLFLVVFLLLCSILKAQNEFITIWKPSNTGFIPTSSTSTQIYFPGVGTNYRIYWEEVGYPAHNGTINNITTTLGSPLLIDFGTAFNLVPTNATYIVKAHNGSGNFHRICFYIQVIGTHGDNHKIINVTQWGNTQWSTMERAFNYCTEMNVTATDIPFLDNVTNMYGMFAGCYELVGNSTFSNWNISNVTTLAEIFYFAKKFNQPISSWDISNVTDLSLMFSNAELFNQPIGVWDTSNVTNMAGIFMGTLTFNQPLASWDTSKVTNMSQMFFDTALFDQLIGNWDTSKVTNMAYLFSGTEKFDRPIANWDTSKVTNMMFMFHNAFKFNQPIGNWNTSLVTDMSGMFRENHLFNQPIENWDTSKVTNMLDMFAGSKKFNQPIGTWNTSLVTNMRSMFYEAQLFNQPIENWNTSNVTTMYSMFQNSPVFNQPLDNWDTSKVTDMRNMLKNAAVFNQNLSSFNLAMASQIDSMLDFSGLSCNNYNSTLHSWANSVSTPNNLTLGSSGLAYSTPQAVAARNILISLKGWTITNDIYDVECNVLTTSEVNKKNLEIYPNPVKNTLFFSEELQSIEIYSLDGRLLKRSLKGNQIDIHELQKGTYILKVTDNSGNLLSEKFIKD